MFFVGFIAVLFAAPQVLAKPWEEVVIVATPTPTPTPTPTTTTATTATTTSTTPIPPNPCPNGCIISIGTENGPLRPPPVDIDYNGGNPMITSFPTTQP